MSKQRFATLEKNRYVSNFALAIDEAEAFEAMQVGSLVCNEFGAPQPYVTEMYVVPGKIHETFEVNHDTLDDVWVVRKWSTVEFHVVVFESEEQKALYLKKNSKYHKP